MQHGARNTEYIGRLKFSAGFSLIDVVLAIGIIALLFGGIFVVYFSILDLVKNIDVKVSATSVLNRQVEIIRNVPYEGVGTVGGVPSGVIPQEQTIIFGYFIFSIKTTVRNIDDPFDGMLGGTPNDTAPADYKIVEMEISCPGCAKFAPLIFTTTVAPKNLESASSNGSLFVNVFDANGIGVGGTSAHVVNNSVTPTIDLSDATNASGVLQLVGVPTSTQNYQITVSKTGYSSEKTYPVGDPQNPNPAKPHATVAAQTVTQLSFSIDRVSRVNVYSSGDRCEAIPNINFSVTGSKLIGSSPDVLKFSTSSNTGSNGGVVLNNIEWDTYSFSMTEAGYDVLGTIPFARTIINPGSTFDFRFVVQPTLPKSFLVTVKDALSGNGITGANVTLSKSGFSSVATTGHSLISETDWSGGKYSSQDGGVDAENFPGSLRMLANASSTYNTSTLSWLISNTIDFGSASSTFYALHWNPVSQLPATGQESLKFQLATNNDSSTWNFAGPDGASGSYYTISSSTIWNEQSSNRYLRYKVYLSTRSEFDTPVFNDMTVEFGGMCVPPHQVLFNNLTSGDYDLTATAPGYQIATSTVTISGNWYQADILMNQQ